MNKNWGRKDGSVVVFAVLPEAASSSLSNHMAAVALFWPPWVLYVGQ